MDLQKLVSKEVKINMSTEENNSDVYVRFVNVTKKFGNFTAVDHINIEIHKGEILGFLGPNGAGKSTTMKMMANLLKPTEGEIWIRNNGFGYLEKLTSRNKDDLLNNLGFLIENPAFYDDMTPREILSYFAELKGYPANKTKARVEEVVKMVGLMDWIDKKTKTFSKGMRQKIGIVSAIVHDPDIIVLDEPHTGLDPSARVLVRNFIMKLKALNKTIFLSSHLLYEVSEVADRVAMISNGKIVACDTLDNLELAAKKSIIHLELLDKSMPINETISKLSSTLQKITSLENSTDFVKYNLDAKVYEIMFNGEAKTQTAILRSLVQNDFNVLEFSVPKADLLEDLYLQFMADEKKAVAYTASH